MGNTSSSAKNLTNEIDRIASNYIFSMTDDVLSKMSEKDYCNKLVILTAKIFDEKLNNLEKKEVLERVSEEGEKKKEEGKKEEGKKEEGKKEEGKKEEGKKEEGKKEEGKKEEGKKKKEEGEKKKEEEEEEEEEGEKKKKEDPEKKKKKEEDDKESDDKKEKEKLKGGDNVKAEENNNNKEDCLKIAKFYVKIAHVYAAIMKTINPVITANDKQGNLQKYDLSTKQKIASDTDIKNIRHNNFCNRRLTTLLQESDINQSDPNNKILKIKPRFCNMNYDNETKKQRVFALKGGQFSEDDDEDEKKREKEKKKKKKEENGDEDEDEDKKKEKEKEKKKKKKDEDDEDDEDIKKKKKKKDEEDEDVAEDDEDDNEKIKKMKKDETITPFKEKDTEDKKEKEDKKEDKKEIKKLAPVIIKEDKVLKVDNTEIGIPELKKLYYDVYDEKSKTFASMSPDMKKEYEKDVADFYFAFTGQKMPMDENGEPKFKTFDQISLRDFKKNDGCKTDGIFTKEYEGLLTTQFGQENLFIKYANHVKKMMFTMNENQDKLLAILKQLFTFKAPEKDIKIGEVIINPNLDEKFLQNLINTTRKLIVKLYIQCEMDFLEGIHIFEAIVSNQLAKTINSQVSLLDVMTENYLEHTEL